MKMKHRLPVILLSFAFFLLLITLIFIFPLDNGGGSQTTDLSGNDDNYIPETIIYDDIISDPITDNTPDGVSYKVVESTVITDKANGSRIVERYPRFDGYHGLNTDTDINYLIDLHRKDMMRTYGEGLYKEIGSQSQVVYEIESFEVAYADLGFISIVYYGYNSIIGGNLNVDTGRREFCCTLNIDVLNMSIIEKNEILSDLSILKNVFLDGKMKLVDGPDGLLSSTTYEDLFYQYSSKYKIYPDFYFTKENIMIIISLTPDVDGYAVFSYNINEARDFIYEDHSALSDLFS